MTDPYQGVTVTWGDSGAYTYWRTATVYDPQTNSYTSVELRPSTDGSPPEVVTHWEPASPRAEWRELRESTNWISPEIMARWEPASSEDITREPEGLHPATPDDRSPRTRTWAQKVNDRAKGDAELTRAAVVAQARAWEAEQELYDFEDDESVAERIKHGKIVPERPVSFSWM
jgi:hypothetical protein